MNREQAIERYFKYNKKSEATINSIMKWDDKLTIVQNSIKLGTHKCNALLFAKRYKFKYVKGKVGGWNKINQQARS